MSLHLHIRKMDHGGLFQPTAVPVADSEQGIVDYLRSGDAVFKWWDPKDHPVTAYYRKEKNYVAPYPPNQDMRLFFFDNDNPKIEGSVSVRPCQIRSTDGNRMAYFDLRGFEPFSVFVNAESHDQTLVKAIIKLVPDNFKRRDIEQPN